MKTYTQKTVIHAIRNYMSAIGVDIESLRYGANRTVIVVTQNGEFVFSYDNNFKLISEP